MVIIYCMIMFLVRLLYSYGKARVYVLLSRCFCLSDDTNHSSLDHNRIRLGYYAICQAVFGTRGVYALTAHSLSTHSPVHICARLPTSYKGNSWVHSCSVNSQHQLQVLCYVHSCLRPQSLDILVPSRAIRTLPGSTSSAQSASFFSYIIR